MVRLDITEEITIPEGVTAEKKDSEIIIKGPKGELKREFQNRKITTKVEGNKIIIESKKATLKEKKILYTEKAHIKNMITGVTEGFEYKLKICSGHFPMTVTIKGDELEIKNYIGEKVPRKLKIKPGVEVKINGDEITVTGINKELAGQVSADIEKLSRRVGFDRRIFQDGIYITHKAGKAV